MLRAAIAEGRKPPMLAWPDPFASCILAPNHISLSDGPVIAARSPRRILFAVDPDFALSPVWSTFMRAWGAVTRCDFVAAGPGRILGLRALLARLELGGWVCLFPQGGVSPAGEAALPDLGGLEWLARRSGAPVYRVAMRPRSGVYGRYRLSAIASIEPAKVGQSAGRMRKAQRHWTGTPGLMRPGA
jgi:1-acyl-sn-glycerol-3-phosphate acyltransferase